jgi:hypothetical protein
MDGAAGTSMRLTTTIVLLACLLWPRATRAAETWTYAASDHFEVYTTSGGKQAREALAYFERVHAFFADFLHLTPQQSRPTRVIVFSGDREFKPYRLNEAAIAYYRAGPDRDYIVMQSFDPEAYPIVVHEYAHLIVRHSGRSYPTWLNEGLAEFFSTLSPLGGKMTIGRVPLGRLRELSVSGLLPLGRLIGVTSESPEYNTANRAGVFYAESWALAHMLWMQDGYRGKTQAFLDAVAHGSSVENAFQSVFARPMAQVASDLALYVKSTTFKFFTSNYRDPKPASEYDVRPVPAFEARLMTATLLAEGRETETAARTALSALEAEQPDNAAVLEARAYLELWHGHEEAAAPFMSRAIAKGSRNASIYRDYAMTVASPAEAASLLEKAAALDPSNIEVGIRYAEALLREQRAADALKALERIKDLPLDEAFMFFQVAANAYLANDEFDNAKASAAKAVQYAEPGREAAYAEQLAKRIDDFVARRAAAQESIRNAPAATDASTPARAAESAASTRDAAARPTTSRGETPFADIVTIVEGRIWSLACNSQPVVMQVVQSDSTIVRFVIDDPQKIKIIGKDGITTDLTCGSQSTKVRLGYEPSVDERLHTLGVIRLLDFR